jgi:hypothetical protein
MRASHAGHGGSHPPGRRRGPLRARRAAGTAGATLALALGLAACANQDGEALARQACQHVERSLALYRTSLEDPGTATSGDRQEQAMAQLRDALPLASNAAGDSGQFQGLMSTLAESDHLPESLLVHALSEQCAASQSNGIAVTPVTSGGETPPTHPPPVGT